MSPTFSVILLQIVMVSPGTQLVKNRESQSRTNVACVGARKNGRARGRHSRGEGGPARKAHEKRFNSHSVSADISSWSRGSRGKE